MNQQEAIEAAKALPWARWVAQDADGWWYAYDSEPFPDESTYLFHGSKCKEVGADMVSIGPKLEITR